MHLSISLISDECSHRAVQRPSKGTAAQLKVSYTLTTASDTYLERSILSNTRFAVISAIMMLLEIPSRA